MIIQSFRPTPQARPLKTPTNPKPPEEPRDQPLLSKQMTLDIGATTANTLVSGISAGLGGLTSGGGPLMALAAGLGGAITGAVAGSVINYQAMEIAERKSPSRNMYGLITVGLNVGSCILAGAAAGVAGHYGANAVLTGAVGGVTTMGGLALLSAAAR